LPEAGSAAPAELLVVLAGIHQTLSAERMMKEHGVRVALVPTPPVVRTGCGFSLLVSAAKQEAAPPWWGELGLPAVLYRVVQAEGRKSYEEIDRREGAGVPPAGDDVQKSDGRGGPR
jgi:Putative Se/S carrier protein-like